MQKNEMFHPDFFWQTTCKINSLKTAKEFKTDHDRAIFYFSILARSPDIKFRSLDMPQRQELNVISLKDNYS